MNTLEILFDPMSVFTRLNERSSWLPPFIVAVCLALTTFFLMSPIVDRIAFTQLPAGVSDETRERLTEWLRMTKIYGVASLPLLVLLKWSVSALLLYAIATLFGADTSYRKTLSVIGYCSIVTSLDSLLSTLVMHLRGVENLDPKHMQGTLLSLDQIIGSAEHPVQQVIYQSINILSIWYYVLLVVGIASITRLTRKESSIVVGLTWLTQLGFAGVLAMILSRSQSTGP